MSNISLSECLACKIVIGKNKRLCDYLVFLSTPKSRWIWTLFLSLELLLGNIRNQGTAFVILFGEFNVRSKNRWVQDIRKNEGTQIDFISSLYVFS